MHRFIKSSTIFSKITKRRQFQKAKLNHLNGTKDQTIAFGMEMSGYKDVVSDTLFGTLIDSVGPAGLTVIAHYLSEHTMLIVFLLNFENCLQFTSQSCTGKTRLEFHSSRHK